MNRRRLLATGAGAIASVVAGCSSLSSSGGKSTPPTAQPDNLVIKVRATGAIDAFQTLTLRVHSIGIDPASGDSGKLPANETISLTDAASSPVTAAQTHFVAERYAGFSLNATVKEATSSDGSHPTVSIPKGAFEFKKSYELHGKGVTTLTVTIHVAKSGNGYTLTAPKVTTQTSNG